uniref:Uncharacterized protein n=1 Tax=Eptatretus burgeri TaxID=7764 RepID=A0A8C4PYG5_EPTBU
MGQYLNLVGPDFRYSLSFSRHVTSKFAKTALPSGGYIFSHRDDRHSRMGVIFMIMIYWLLFLLFNASAPMVEAEDVTKHTVVLGDPGVSANGLAVDWIHRNLYWTDAVKKTLGVAKLDSLRRKTLFNNGLSEPSAVAVDPLKGFVYWSDWGVKAKIEKAGMNGIGRRTLVSADIEWPNGITLDLLNERLYWADSKLHSLSSVDLDGGDRRTVVQSSSHVQHPFAIAIFEDMVFWLDGQSEGIFKANKFTGQGVQPVVQHLKSAQDLLVHHQLLQPEGTDWCSNAGLANGGCEFLCLPAPQITARSAKYTCVCPDGAQLRIDGLRCQPGPVSSFQLPNSIESPSLKEQITIQMSTHGQLAHFQKPTQQVQVATSQDSVHSGTTILSVLLPIGELSDGCKQCRIKPRLPLRHILKF